MTSEARYLFRCTKCGHRFESKDPGGHWCPQCKSVRIVPRLHPA